MKNLSEDLKRWATKIMNYEKKEILSLTNEENKSFHKKKVCYICKKEFSNDNKDSEIAFKYYRVRDHCHYTGKNRDTTHNIWNLRYRRLKEIPVVFHSGSKHDYHFIIQELVEEFKGELECLGENTDKFVTFSVQINKKTWKW